MRSPRVPKLKGSTGKANERPHLLLTLRWRERNSFALSLALFRPSGAHAGPHPSAPALPEKDADEDGHGRLRGACPPRPVSTAF